MVVLRLAGVEGHVALIVGMPVVVMDAVVRM